MARGVIEDERVERFGAALYGPSLRPSDPKYDDETRAVEDGMIDERPELFARGAGVADVRPRSSADRDEEQCDE